MNKRDLITFCWKYKLFSDMHTRTGKAIEVIDPGLADLNRTMFFNAKICIDGVLYVGKVMVFEKISQWYELPKDKDYNAVLVLAGYYDCDDTDSDRFDLICFPQIPESVDFRSEILMSDVGCDMCYRYNSENLSSLRKHSWLSAMTTEWLQKMTEKAGEIYGKTKSWDKTLFVMMSMAVNRRYEKQYEKWALSIPVEKLDNVSVAEATLFGMAGLLDDRAITNRARNTALMEGYYQKMFNKWKTIKILSCLSSDMLFEEWYYSYSNNYLRAPEYYPYVDMSRLAHIIVEDRYMLGKYLACENYEDMRNVLDVHVSEYWRSHSQFGGKTRTGDKPMSSFCKSMIIMYAVIPVMFLYGKTNRKEDICDNAFDLIEQSRIVYDDDVMAFSEKGIDPENSCDGVGLSHLKREYCNRKKCLRCKFGYNYIMEGKK